MNARVSPEGITADLEAMQDAHIGGAYLMPIKGPTDPPEYAPLATQLSPRFWQMVRHAAREADRLGLELGMHACDGFAVAGGPWVTPELSMQHLVWQRAELTGGQQLEFHLEQPESHEGYYRDIAVLAFPQPPGADESTAATAPSVTTSDGDTDAARLAESGNQRQYRSPTPCWIQYAFSKSFTCRTITIVPGGNNYQCQRMRVMVSNDGQSFREAALLQPPRHGWQDEGQPVTHSIPETAAKFFRFVWDPQGSEPGAEDLDSAKWAPVLKVNSITLAGEACLPHYRGKSGSLWRIGPWATTQQLPNDTCVPLGTIIDLTAHLNEEGQLSWNAPPGRWSVLRLGHTSTGRRNETGGGGLGLECDKLNPAAARLQFYRWFREAQRQVGREIGAEGAARVLTTFHVDSWECGSQNWTKGFRSHFLRLRGYDPTRYLPCMAGVPVESADISERFLRDCRATIADLLNESFYGTLAELTSEHNVRFTGECTAPTMTGDGLRHFSHVDVPMGEFWLNSPTHDKPSDMRDAVSAAHLYGKRIIQAEAFTQLRMGWDEAPSSLKPLGDRNLALGANRLVMHVFTHNPWLDRLPGQTLGGVGLYFQRDQPWLAASRAWMDHLSRCQALLQSGTPVVDIAVWSGDELPSRSITPERLVHVLPGLIGETAIDREIMRLANRGQPQREAPTGVRASAGIVDQADWVDPLRGYAYDSINSDAILRLATVERGRVVLPGGSSYGLLVLPGRGPQTPGADRMTPEVAEKLAQLVEAGATVLCYKPVFASPSLTGSPFADKRTENATERMMAFPDRFLTGPWIETNLDRLGIALDMQVIPSARGEIAWSHRAGEQWDAYFVSNQEDVQRVLTLSLRAKGDCVEIWDPVMAKSEPATGWRRESSRTEVPINLAPYQSLFVVVRSNGEQRASMSSHEASRVIPIEGPWELSFQSSLDANPPSRSIKSLTDLSLDPDDSVRSFVGETVYSTTFTLPRLPSRPTKGWLEATALPLAEVHLNNKDNGALWTAPWKLEVSKSLREGENRLVIRVPSTWKNRLLADALLPIDERRTWTAAPVHLANDMPTPYGLLGPVRLILEMQ